MSSGNPETRRRIMIETRRLLEEKGGQNVRLKDIAQAAEVSRQAIYLHFGSRTGLLVATVQFVDELQGFFKRTRAIREVESGTKALELFIAFWAEYITEVYGLARALLASRANDPAALAAWTDRMDGLQKICLYLIKKLANERRLKGEWSIDEAADMLWALISVQTWENLTVERGWKKEQYQQNLEKAIWGTFIADPPNYQCH